MLRRLLVRDPTLQDGSASSYPRERTCGCCCCCSTCVGGGARGGSGDVQCILVKHNSVAWWRPTYTAEDDTPEDAAEDRADDLACLL